MKAREKVTTDSIVWSNIDKDLRKCIKEFLR